MNLNESINKIRNMFSNTDVGEMWNTISEGSLNEILDKSKNETQLIYKHSNRCSICFFTKGEIESIAADIEGDADLHFIDVVKQRDISNKIASELGVQHESPQLICVENGKAVWHLSHNSIQADPILEKLKS